MNADGVVKMLTVAPEVCDPDIIKLLNDNGIVVAAGHSNATFKEAVQGFKRGIRTTTHLFNACRSCIIVILVFRLQYSKPKMYLPA